MAILIAVLALGAVADADVVALRSGGKIVGRARRVGERVYVEAMAGETHVPASSVARIDEEHEAPIEIYFERQDALRASPGIEGHLEMVAWLLENRGRRFVSGHVAAVTAMIQDVDDPAWILALARTFESRLEAPLRPVWERLLRLDPEQEQARRALGFRRLGDHWATEEEWQASQGNVEFEGKWIPREMRDMMLEERAAKLAKRIRDVRLRETRIERREAAVEQGRKDNTRVEGQLRRQAQDQARRESVLDDRERDVEARERVLDGLLFGRSCRGYHSRLHICSSLWRFCARCQGYFRGGHRCR